MRPGLVVLVLLAACADTGTPPLSGRQTAPVGISLVPDAQGLGIAGSPKRIDFGRSPRGVVPVLTRELGAPRALGLEGCPVGVVQQMAWGDLVLSFTRERFVGWRMAQTRAGQTCA